MAALDPVTGVSNAFTAFFTFLATPQGAKAIDWWLAMDAKLQADFAKWFAGRLAKP
jgi:hypothetical protein